jgi:hypothetical protein
MKEKQIKKQLQYALSILKDIEIAYAAKSLRYGKFAYDIQLNEINRLRNLMKLLPILICLILVGCENEQEKLDKDVKKMFEFIECPISGVTHTNMPIHSTSN